MNQIIPVKKIDSIQFRLLSSEEIEKMSYVEIKNKSGVENGIYKVDSAYDTRLGTIAFNEKCKTCGANQKTECGHPGFIRLVRPVFNTSFMSYILKIYKCICSKCDKFLIDESRFEQILKLDKELRLNKCISLIKKITCKACDFINPTYKILRK